MAVTRALGDHALKDQGVICAPDVSRHVLNSEDKLLVIASDGLWDVVNENELTKYIMVPSTKEIAKDLLKTALARETKDNIAIIVLSL